MQYFLTLLLEIVRCFISITMNKKEGKKPLQITRNKIITIP